MHLQPLAIASAGLALAVVVMTPAARATTYTLNAQYFTIAGTYNGPGSGDPDFNTIGCCTATFFDEVRPNLGPDGLPVYNTASTAPRIHDVNSAGEITWWSPSMNSNVTATGTGAVTVPYQNSAFYPPNGTGSNDFQGFQGAIFSGQITLPTAESVQFTLGADDDSFLYLNNTIVTQEGGIHGVSPAPVASQVLAAGTYSLELFYVDRNVTGAGLDFSIDTTGLTVTPPPAGGGTGGTSVPEPASLALVAGGLLGLGFTRRKAV